MARKINYIIVHCTATPEGRRVTNEEITRWHKARGRRSRTTWPLWWGCMSKSHHNNP